MFNQISQIVVTTKKSLCNKINFVLQRSSLFLSASVCSLLNKELMQGRSNVNKVRVEQNMVEPNDGILVLPEPVFF